VPDLDGTAGLYYFIILLWSSRVRFGRYCRSILFYYGVAVPDLGGTAGLYYFIAE